MILVTRSFLCKEKLNGHFNTLSPSVFKNIHELVIEIVCSLFNQLKCDILNFANITKENL